jgi:hypothetical protein
MPALGDVQVRVRHTGRLLLLLLLHLLYLLCTSRVAACLPLLLTEGM